jgi:hypothetical protein
VVGLSSVVATSTANALIRPNDGSMEDGGRRWRQQCLEHMHAVCVEFLLGRFVLLDRHCVAW